jgi:hypothetical protein
MIVLEVEADAVGRVARRSDDARFTDTQRGRARTATHITMSSTLSNRPNYTIINHSWRQNTVMSFC